MGKYDSREIGGERRVEVVDGELARVSTDLRDVPARVEVCADLDENIVDGLPLPCVRDAGDDVLGRTRQGVESTSKLKETEASSPMAYERSASCSRARACRHPSPVGDPTAGSVTSRYSKSPPDVGFRTLSYQSLRRINSGVATPPPIRNSRSVPTGGSPTWAP
jgi:hypothetical protein